MSSVVVFGLKKGGGGVGLFNFELGFGNCGGGGREVGERREEGGEGGALTWWGASWLR